MINDPWALLCEVSLWGWQGAALGFILRSFPTRDAFNKRTGAVWGSCFIFFYILWTVGMLKV